MQAKTADAARPLVTKVQAKLSWLYKKLRSGEYGDSEISAAILHAAAMERIAKRKVRHLEAEEAAENNGAAADTPQEEDIFGKDELFESLKENEDFSEEIMKQMMEEIEELEKELTEEILPELQDMITSPGRDLSEEELREFTRKHRDEEDRQLTKADLKYLKSLFDRLEQEKKQVSSGSFRTDSSNSFSCAVDCLPEAELVAGDAGGCIDVNI